MPFVANMHDDDENKQSQPQTPQGPISPSGPGGGAVRLAPSTAVQTSGTGTNASPTGAGGQFASMNQYLKANMGQAEPLAGKLTAGISKEYQGLEGQNQQALSNIGGQVAASPSYTNANDVIAQEAANPASFTSNPSNVISFQNLLNASYSGPASAESTNEYANQQASINKAISQGQNAVQTEAGRENLLTKNEATPTTGVTALNSAILSKSPTALGAVENAYKPFQNLLTGLQSGATETNKAIAERQAQAGTAKKTAADALTTQMSGLNTTVGNELTSAQQKLAAQNAQVKSELAAGTPSDSTLQTLGISRDQWNSLSTAQKAAATSQDVFSNQNQFGAQSGTTNVDLTNFLNQNDPNVSLNAANVATPEDYAKAKAFQSLMGGLNFAAPTMAINPTTSTQAGTAPTTASNFDYQTALTTAQQAKTDQIAAAQAYVDALQSGADENHAQLAAQDAMKKAGIQKMTAIAQTPLAATGAVLAGAPTAAQTYLQKLTSSNPAQIAANVGTMGLAPLAQGIGSGVQKAVDTVTNIFCFHPDTLVTMNDGSQLPICRIAVGDITKGGKVLATTRAIGQDFYYYNGVIVTGKHAVKENGTWIRVENSRLGHQFKYLTEVVCNLVTEKHRIFASGIEFADQYETDLYESLDMNESLRELNRQ